MRRLPEYLHGGGVQGGTTAKVLHRVDVPGVGRHVALPEEDGMMQKGNHPPTGFGRHQWVAALAMRVQDQEVEQLVK